MWDQMNAAWVAIGQRLKRLRLALGYTNAKAFSESMGISDTAWNNWEHGRREIPTSAALKVCGKTGASLDFIFRDMPWTLPPHVLARLEAYDESVRKEAEKADATRRAANG